MKLKFNLGFLFTHTLYTIACKDSASDDSWSSAESAMDSYWKDSSSWIRFMKCTSTYYDSDNATPCIFKKVK